MFIYLKKIILLSGHKFLSAIEKGAKDSEAQMIAFGIFGVLNYPIFYFIWSIISRQPYESVGLRLLAGLLCLFLVFKNFWPQKIRKYLALYWYLTLLICLPFFCTFMFLKNHGSEGWVLNGMLVLFLLILVTEYCLLP
jgi:two-component system CAI-1 autoinducer sensor kinase/phosphatase CqsS